MSENHQGTGIVSGNISSAGSEPGNTAVGTCEDKFTRLVMRSWDGILLTSEDGSLVEWNPAMEQITGLSRSAVMGKKLWDVQFSLVPSEKKTPELLGRLTTFIQAILETGHAEDFERSSEHEIRCPDNQLKVIEACMFTIPAGTGHMAGAIFRDITLRKRAELGVQESNRKLHLMSSITRHDINNQLTIVSGYLALLETGTSSMKSGDIIRILQGATGKIQRILKFTREYQDVGVKSPAWQDLGETIRHAKTLVEIGQVRLAIGPACSGTEVFADPMLARVFANLIDNSLRHGEKVSEIRVDCREEGHQLLIVYEDNGTGIPDSIRPVLYDHGKGKNTGYGMFLIREILAITGFTIAETGHFGTGVRFGISVPAGSFRVTGKNQQA